MPKLVRKLSALKVASLSEPGWYCDGNCLWLQVTATGAKTWVYRYNLDGKRRHMGLGPLRQVSLADARMRAEELAQRIRAGSDPLAEERRKEAARRSLEARRMTFDACARAFIKAHRTSWRNEKHARQWEATLATYASPTCGQLPVDEIDTAIVVRILEPIWTEKTETAKRLRGRIEAILDWATVSKYRSGDNPARWKGHLDYLLADPGRIAPVEHHPALPWKEAPAFMAQLRLHKGYPARALEFAIWTAARSGEVRGARWGEIDMEAALWTVPAARMKAGVEHRVPLAEHVLGQLAALGEHGEFVFPGRGGGMVSDMSMTAVLRRMGRADITVHGFRSTFRDWCAEQASNVFSREVCEHALAHKLPDKVEAAYRRSDLLDKRRMLMDEWARFLISGQTS